MFQDLYLYYFKDPMDTFKICKLSSVVFIDQHEQNRKVSFRSIVSMSSSFKAGIRMRQSHEEQKIQWIIVIREHARYWPSPPQHAASSSAPQQLDDAPLAAGAPPDASLAPPVNVRTVYGSVAPSPSAHSPCLLHTQWNGVNRQIRADHLCIPSHS